MVFANVAQHLDNINDAILPICPKIINFEFTPKMKNDFIMLL